MHYTLLKIYYLYSNVYSGHFKATYVFNWSIPLRLISPTVKRKPSLLRRRHLHTTVTYRIGKYIEAQKEHNKYNSTTVQKYKSTKVQKVQKVKKGQKRQKVQKIPKLQKVQKVQKVHKLQKVQKVQKVQKYKKYKKKTTSKKSKKK